MTDGLSAEQRSVLGPDVAVVEAGPGSGKTRALVARYLQTAGTGHRGAALLSFTNAAIDEVRNRTGHSAHLLKAPNFVGTIDAFLHRFILTPDEVRRRGRLPTYLATWSDLSTAQTVRLREVEGRNIGISLDAFNIQPGGKACLHETTLSRVEKHHLAVIDAAGRRDELIRCARQRILDLVKAGVWSSNAARVRALAILNSEIGPKVAERIGYRFAELLIDEAQDCDEVEMAILAHLGRATRTILVADPDQAVFEFRGGRTDLFVRYRDAQDPAHVVSLSTNHRSTTAICAAVNALRAVGLSSVRSATAAVCDPVVLLRGAPLEQAAKFRAELDRIGIPLASAIVLGHSASVARAVAGSPDVRVESTAAGNRLAIAVGALAGTATTAVDRLDAMRSVERILLSLVAWDPDERSVGTMQQLKLLGVRPEWLRQRAGLLVAALAPVQSAAEFGVCARTQINAMLEELPRAVSSLGPKVQRPDAKHWARRVASTEAIAGLAAATIHSSKGREFDAVLVALPRMGPHAGLDAWQTQSDAEARRVLYVGASRARRLLAFGAGSQAGRMATLLRTSDVPCTVL